MMRFIFAVMQTVGAFALGLIGLWAFIVVVGAAVASTEIVYTAIKATFGG